MIIDCDRCRMRDLACHDCVVTVLLGPPGGAVEGFDPEERAALGALADGGLIPPLRLAVLPDGPPCHGENVQVEEDRQWQSVI